MSQVLCSLRIYVPKLVRQWWASVGLLFALVGLVVKLAGWLEPPAIFWLTVSVLTVAIAAFQLFHGDRVAAHERSIETRGPELPYWVGIGLRGNRDATYLTVIGCSEDPKLRPPSTMEFPILDQELAWILAQLIDP